MHLYHRAWIAETVGPCLPALQTLHTLPSLHYIIIHLHSADLRTDLLAAVWQSHLICTFTLSKLYPAKTATQPHYRQ